MGYSLVMIGFLRNFFSGSNTYDLGRLAGVVHALVQLVGL